MTTGMDQEMNKTDIQSLWDYNDPASSEVKLRAVLDSQYSNKSFQAELLTQIARAQGLQRKFDDAHATLDQAEVLIEDEMHKSQARLLLERGRTFNSSGKKDQARPLFIEAWEIATQNNLDGLAIDAAHMIAIVEDADHALMWNQKALDLAISSNEPDAQRWKGSLCNNIGWTHHDNGDFDTALEYFQQALDHRIEQDKAEETRIAQWCVARCLRSLGKVEEALAIQKQLEKENASVDNPDGHIPEEIAECLYKLGKKDEAKPNFQRAYEMLLKDPWLVENEPKRIERLRELGSD